MITLEIEKVCGVDEVHDTIFKVEVFDEAIATVTIVQNGFTLESWREAAEAIGKAIEMLELTK
jgi:hypothetical protein